MPAQYRFIFLALFIILLVACGEELPPTPTSAPTAEATATAAVTPSPTNTPRPTETPSPTPLPPAINVPEQTVYGDGVVAVESVTIPADGWLAVYRQSQAELSADDLLGVIAVEAGEQQGLQVTIDGEKATSVLQFALHVQENPTAEFDPAASELLLITSFEVTLQLVEPQIVVNEQEVLEDGLVVVEQVVTENAGWIGIHNQTAEGMGDLLGYLPVKAGTNEQMAINIRWREAVPALTAVLYEDNGAAGDFEYGAADGVMSYAGTPVTADFKVSLPPVLVLFDQPVIESQFVVDRIISDGAAWLVAYQQDENEQPGFIIGFAALQDGLNENVVVEVDGSAVTDTLLLTLHDDTGTLGEFDFPANDPRRDYQERAFFTPLNTATGSYLIVRDQAVADEQVTVSLVVAAVDLWAVVYSDEAGEPGEIIGQAFVPAGFAQEVVVELTAAPTTQLHVLLHADNGVAQEFEPQTADSPILRQGAALAIPFMVVEP